MNGTPALQSDGYYYLNVPTDSGRRMIKARSLDQLEEKRRRISPNSKPIQVEALHSFRKIHAAVQERKLELTKGRDKTLSVQNSILRRKQHYNRYFSGTRFEQLPVEKITADDIEEIYLYNLKRYDLRYKATMDMRSGIKTVMDYAMRKRLITVNPYQACDFEQFKDMILPDRRISDRGYTKAEMDAMMEFIHDRQLRDPLFYTAYAMEMQIICGMRRGEVPPLRWTDVHDGYIDICREQITIKEAKGVKEHDELVDHTKTWTDRRFPLTDAVMNLLVRLKEAQYKDGYDGIFLFPGGRNGCISNHAVYQFYRRMCDKVGVQVEQGRVRGTHAFRRNAITDIINKTGGNSILASKLYGNTPEIAEKYYYTGIDMDLAKKLLDS